MRQSGAGERPHPAEMVPGLRERKRVRTKLMVQAEALKLFDRKGYEQTTVDDIAHAAAMSPRTFFRYFPTKEDVVLWDEFDDVPFQAMWDHGVDGEPLARLIADLRMMLQELHDRDPQLLLTRIRLSFAVPEIRARFLDQSFHLAGPYYTQLAAAFGVPADDLRLPVLLSAVYGGMMVAVERWQREDGRENLLDLFDRSMDALANGLADLREALPATKPAQQTRRRQQR